MPEPRGAREVIARTGDFVAELNKQYGREGSQCLPHIDGAVKINLETGECEYIPGKILWPASNTPKAGEEG